MKLVPSCLALGLVIAPPALEAATPRRETVAPAPGYAAIASALEKLVNEQMADKKLPAVSIALVEKDRVVWARGFGYSDPDKKRPATAETIYRVGSVSKLFTDIGIMRLREQGAIDIDAPVTRYLPDFAPKIPWKDAKPITLRMLMSHRSGLIREPPVGNYFATNEPSLADTIRSLNETTLVYHPEEKAKYSNAGIAAVGFVLETTQNKPFAPYLEKAVLVPMGLNRSSFEKKPALAADLAKAYMWTYDGRTFEAPTFRFGMDPCGAMYSTVLDLGRFMSVLFAKGATGAGKSILKPETLEAMWTPQFAPAGTKRGFGIGFAVNELDGHRWVGHDGAVYGFATTLQALPDAGLGVVAVTTKDGANSAVDRIALHALRMMLAQKDGKPLPEAKSTTAIDPADARRLAGRYRKGDEWVELEEREGELFVSRSDDDVTLRLRRDGDSLITDDTLGFGATLKIEGNKLTRGDVVYEKQEPKKPAAPPAKWGGLIGEYGWDHNTLYVYEKDGKLETLIEWFTAYPLEEESENVYRFPKSGLYDNENVVFKRDASGRATEVVAANVTWKRRTVGGEGQSVFRIKPQRPVDELIAEALRATPPKQAANLRPMDLAELSALDPSIRLDIRYASTDNFLGTPIYKQPRAFLQRPAAEALVRAHRALAKQGLGLLIHDGYRPWYVTKVFWDATPAEGKIFVADPSQGSRYNRGCAVDLTLYSLSDGKPVEMVGLYDEMSSRSFPNYPGGTSLQRYYRRVLHNAMQAEGFGVYEWEWWHFDYKDWAQYPVGNVTFESMGKTNDAPVPASAPAKTPIPFEKRDVMIPMRDGVKLHTEIYTPKDTQGPLPVILTRTPYGLDPGEEGMRPAIENSYRELADDGYVFVFQDIRGRSKSEGSFVMLRNPREGSDPRAIDESTDTFDTVDWLLKNTKTSERVGMLGVSYGGWLTVMAMLDPHPALKAVSPQASPADMYIGDDFHHNGAFRLSYGLEYVYGLETSKDVERFSFDRADTFEWYLKLGALSNVNAKYFKGKRPSWNDFVEHPDYDAFWKRQAVKPYLTRVSIPTLNVGGWFDQEDFYGPLTIYQALETKDTAKQNFLVVGPWNHGGWAHGTGRSLGPIDFGSDTSSDFRKVQARFFAHYLRNQGDLDLAEALTFETGSNKWVSRDSWPSGKNAKQRTLHLRENGGLSFEPPTATAEACDTFVSDPAKPVPYRHRPIEPTYPGPGWPLWLSEDQRFVDDRPDVLTYETDVLTEDVVIAGKVDARLFASTSGTDADWIVKLIDVLPETNEADPKLAGYELMVASDVIRSRYRKGFEKPLPVQPNKVEEISLDLHSRAHRFLKGHRIMVQVQSTWFPVIDRNPQTFVPNIFEARDSDYKAATHRVCRSKAQPSGVTFTSN
jgi:putative CocE/NonD family hydrolase